MTTLQTIGVVYFAFGLLLCYAFDRYNRKHNVGRRARLSTYILLGFTWPFITALAARGAVKELRGEAAAEAEAGRQKVQEILDNERARLRNLRK